MEDHPMSAEHLLYRVTDKVAHFTINREQQRNALSADAVSLFLKYLDQAETDENVRVILITGSGDKAFCSGADLAAVTGGDMAQVVRSYARLLKRLAGYPKPVVAQVNGSCMAGGLGIMLACDIVIARNDAKFGTPEVKVGLFPMVIGALIFRNVLRKKAMEMVLLGESLSAAQALEMGLITRAVTPQKLDATVADTLARLADRSPIGMKIGKQAFYAMADMPFEAALDFLSEKIMDVATTEDAQEGITAFMEKRKPVFKGR
jgi:enoyl-CoA hydratase/carnithine racemase